jgi:hypothetical protein
VSFAKQKSQQKRANLRPTAQQSMVKITCSAASNAHNDTGRKNGNEATILDKLYMKNP